MSPSSPHVAHTKRTCTPGQKTTLDDESVRVAESLQGGHGQRSGLATATIHHQWYIGGRSGTLNLRGQQITRAPLRSRDVRRAELSALTRIDQAEVFAGVQTCFQVFRGDKRDL